MGLLPVATLENDREEYDDQCNDAASPSVVPVQDELFSTSAQNARQVKLEVMHTALRRILDPFAASFWTGFPVEHGGVPWNCFPSIVSYCCDIPEGKDLSSVMHGRTKHPCIRCLIPFEMLGETDSQPTRTALSMSAIYSQAEALFSEATSLQKRRRTGQARLKKKLGEQILQEASVNKQGNVFSSEVYFHNSSVTDMYNIFTVEPLHLLHLGISKRLKECIFVYISALSNDESVFKEPSGNGIIRGAKTALLRGCNSILRAFEADFRVSNLHVDFSSSQKSAQLNGFFTNTGVKGMLEGKDYHQLDMVFPFVAAFIDRASRRTIEAPLTSVCTAYSDLLNTLMFTKQRGGFSKEDIRKLSDEVLSFKKKATDVLGNLDDINLFTLKFHLLDHLCNDLARFGDLSLLDASPFEHFNYVIKSFIRMTSMRKSTTIEEAIRIMNTSRPSEIQRTIVERGRRPQLARDGVEMTLSQCLDSSADFLTHLSDNESASFQTTLLSFLRESEEFKTIAPIPSDVTLTVVKSGTITSGCVISGDSLTPDLQSLQDTVPHGLALQRVFADPSFGPGKVNRFSAISIRGDNESVWFAKVLLLFRMKIPSTEEQQLAFVQYFEVTSPIDGVDDTLNCVCLRWATDDGKDYSTTVPTSPRIEVGEWYGIIPFSSISSVHHIVRGNHPLPPLLPQLPWPCHQFYINRFYDWRQCRN